MTKTEYIAHLRSLGLCKDMAECMAGQKVNPIEMPNTLSEAVIDFAWWEKTEEGYFFWDAFYCALELAEQQDELQDELDLKGLK
jgi:hypothetical protein